jgi:hypothetical protein
MRRMGVLLVLVMLISWPSVADECKKVLAHANPQQMVHTEPCEYQGEEFSWCRTVPVRGTLNGTWTTREPFVNGDDLVRSCDGWTPEDPSGAYDDALAWENRIHFLNLGVSMFRSHDVVETRRGELWATSAWAMNQDFWWATGPGIWAVALFITGGTDEYAGATGWLGIIDSSPYSPDSREGIYIHGVICTVGEDEENGEE